VKLRACDDRRCKTCYQENEKALRALHVSDNRDSCSDKHTEHTKNEKKASGSANKEAKPDTILVISGSEDRFCQACKDNITCDNYVACDMCKVNVHGDCIGLPPETVARLFDIVQHMGWVCYSCRSEGSNKIAQLQSTLVQLSEKFAEVVARVSELETQISVSTSPPAVSKLGCCRLGKHIDGQQLWKLLVHLHSEQSASTLLAEASAALVHLFHSVTRMLESSSYVRALLTDFTKAFDTVDDSVLVDKLGKLQLPGNIYNWIGSFLSNRN